MRKPDPRGHHPKKPQTSKRDPKPSALSWPGHLVTPRAAKHVHIGPCSVALFPCTAFHAVFGRWRSCASSGDPPRVMNSAVKSHDCMQPGAHCGCMWQWKYCCCVSDPSLFGYFSSPPDGGIRLPQLQGESLNANINFKSFFANAFHFEWPVVESAKGDQGFLTPLKHEFLLLQYFFKKISVRFREARRFCFVVHTPIRDDHRRRNDVTVRPGQWCATLFVSGTTIQRSPQAFWGVVE